MAAPGITKRLNELKRALPDSRSPKMLKALEYAAGVYGDRTHDILSAIPLIDHACGVLDVFSEYCPDEDAMVACLLQHALKIPECSVQDIEKQFGKAVRDMVSRMHLLSHLSTNDWRRSIDDMKIMLVSVADDVRLLLLALSHQCYLSEHLNDIADTHVRSRIARQSLDIFAPVAARLGIYSLKYRLEEMAFLVSYPTDAERITEQQKLLKKEYGEFLPAVGEAMKNYLKRENVHCDIAYRGKQSFSIFQKMRSKSLSDMEKINDLFAVRVIVKNLQDCYQVLGLLHKLGTPLTHRFKDYISFPKPNGYQSLHTCLIGLPNAPKKILIEVQIRTVDMHREAEYGVASHWMYKEFGSTGKIPSSFGNLQLSEILLKQHSVSSGSDDDDHVGDVKLVDHMYVLTPRGDIIELPKGGTPLDFAFAVHSDLGLKYKAARVNGHIVPIGHRLENGDIVDIQLHKHPRPSLQWIELLATSSARAKLKNYFFAHNRDHFISRGKSLVNADLRSKKIPALDSELSLLKTFDGVNQSMKQREDLLVKIGMGSLRVGSVLHHLVLPEVVTPVKKERISRAKQLYKAILLGPEGKPLDMPFKFAKCCSVDTLKPRPETITGVATRGGVIMVHKTACKSLKASNPERRMKVKWA